MHSVFPQSFTFYTLPAFSSLNGPANLAYLVQQLELMRTHPAAVRLIPYFGHGQDRELMPYVETRRAEAGTDQYRYLRETLQDPTRPGVLQLMVNVREDNRLRRYLPLVVVGMLPTPIRQEDWENLLERYEAEYRRLSEQLAVSHQRALTDPLIPVTASQCFESFIEQLITRYPELADADAPYDVPDYGLIIPKHRSFVGEEDSAEWYAWRCQTRTVREILQAFLTTAFVTIGSVDLICGREYAIPVFSEERICAVPLKPPLSAQAVSDWLLAFPHYPTQRGDATLDAPAPETPITPPRPSLRMPSFAPVEQLSRETESSSVNIARETLSALRALWTTADPAVHQLTEAIQNAMEVKGEPLGASELLALVSRYVPDYLPTQPQQARIIGGWDITILLLRHLRRRWAKTTLLGVSARDLEAFEPLERDFIEGLLLLRRAFADPVYLFQVAARVAVGSDIEVWWEPYQPVGCELGSDRAALGVSLSLSALAQIHEPRIRVHLPLDRTEHPELAEFAQRKLDVLRRLFLPAHIPVIYQWATEWAVLGETAYLNTNGDLHLPTARLAPPEPAMV